MVNVLAVAPNAVVLLMFRVPANLVPTLLEASAHLSTTPDEYARRVVVQNLTALKNAGN